MVSIPETIARQAAARLSVELGPGLAAQVEARLHPGAPPRRFIEPVTATLAGVLVSLCTLGWTIYKDLAKEAAKPAPEVLVRRLRIELGDTAGVAPAQRDRIIAVVVEEVVKAEGG
jgi:hypothetical protein